MPLPHDSFRQLLKANGQSVTKARLQVFEALLGHEPMAMNELAERTRAVDRASVYRAVDLFERLGILQRLNTGWKYKLELTDKFAEHHHHLTCVQCGRTQSMGEDRLEQFIDKLSANYDFRPTAHQIEIQGYCAICLAKPAPGRF